MFCDNFGWSGKSLQTSMWTYFSFVNKFESPSLRCALCKVWWNGPSGSGEKMFKRRHVFPLSLFLWKERGPSFQHNGILWTKKTDKKRWSEVKRGTAFQPPLLVSIPYEVGVFEVFLLNTNQSQLRNFRCANCQRSATKRLYVGIIRSDLKTSETIGHRL